MSEQEWTSTLSNNRHIKTNGSTIGGTREPPHVAPGRLPGSAILYWRCPLCGCPMSHTYATPVLAREARDMLFENPDSRPCYICEPSQVEMSGTQSIDNAPGTRGGPEGVKKTKPRGPYHKGAFFLGVAVGTWSMYAEVNPIILTAGLLLLALAPWRTKK